MPTHHNIYLNIYCMCPFWLISSPLLFRVSWWSWAGSCWETGCLRSWWRWPSTDSLSQVKTRSPSNLWSIKTRRLESAPFWTTALKKTWRKRRRRRRRWSEWCLRPWWSLELVSHFHINVVLLTKSMEKILQFQYIYIYRHMYVQYICTFIWYILYIINIYLYM